MNDLKLLLFKNEITIRELAKKCNLSDYRMGQKIRDYKLNLNEIKIILEMLDMKFEDVF
jgi:hypothetical protein